MEDRDFRSRLEAPGYRLMQRTDPGLTYWNTRLAQRNIGARYHGVTHEYLDVPGGVQELTGVWYKDHASGSNRVDKFERDIRLLSKALKKEPDNQRYWFYLAQSYRDAGRTAEAAKTYAKRAEMGGWDEEAWYARLSGGALPARSWATRAASCGRRSRPSISARNAPSRSTIWRASIASAA